MKRKHGKGAHVQILMVFQDAEIQQEAFAVRRLKEKFDESLAEQKEKQGTRLLVGYEHEHA